MLTILHRQPNGSEVVFSANQIQRMQPEGEETCPAIGKTFRVWREDMGGVQCEITIEKPFGAVFVMNKHGSTVARYLAQ